MKKVYLLLTSIALATTTMAQIGNENVKPVKKSGDAVVQKQSDRPVQQPVSTNYDRVTVIWEDDFSDMSVWEMDNMSSPPVDWVIDTDVEAPVVPNQCEECIPINTPTAENGYAWVDGDGQGDGSIQDSNIRTVDPIDCSGEDIVSVQFYCVTRNFASTYTVRVSNNGTDWTDFPVLTDVGTNENTANPELVTVNVSSVAANQETVWIEFNFYAEWGWWWAIDDVALVVPDENDLAIGSLQYDGYDPDVSETWEDVEYSVYEYSQVRPLEFSATATNNGSVSQTNAMLEVTITDGEDYVEVLTSAPADIATGEMVTFTISDYIPPSDVEATYTVSYELTSDEISLGEDATPGDNVGEKTFAVSSTTFARDQSTQQYIAGLGIGDEYIAGPAYNTTSEATIHCIGAAIDNTSDIGKDFNYYLYSGDLEYIDETEMGTVTEDMFYVNEDENYTWLNLLSGPYTFGADEDFALMFHHFDEGNDQQVVVGISDLDAPDFTSYVYALYEEQDCFTDGCYTGSTYMVRAGMSSEFCTTAIAEEAEQVSNHNLFPNPSQGQTTLEYTLLEEGEVQIFLFDNNGRIMMQEDKGTQPVGEYRFDYDFSDVAAGNYTMSIMVGDKAINKKLMIK